MAGIGGKEKIDILLVSYNRLNLLQITIKAIKKRTEYPYRLIVIDNGSDDGTIEWILNAYVNKKIDDIVLLGVNIGLGKAFQEGFKKVKSEYFITCTDDVIPPKVNPCWLTQELETIKNNPEYGGITMKGFRITKFSDLDEDLI